MYADLDLDKYVEAEPDEDGTVASDVETEGNGILDISDLFLTVYQICHHNERLPASRWQK